MSPPERSLDIGEAVFGGPRGGGLVESTSGQAAFVLEARDSTRIVDAPRPGFPAANIVDFAQSFLGVP